MIVYIFSAHGDPLCSLRMSEGFFRCKPSSALPFFISFSSRFSLLRNFYYVQTGDICNLSLKMGSLKEFSCEIFGRD